VVQFEIHRAIVMRDVASRIANRIQLTTDLVHALKSLLDSTFGPSS
jgi:hypothetical protein